LHFGVFPLAIFVRLEGNKRRGVRTDRGGYGLNLYLHISDCLVIEMKTEELNDFKKALKEGGYNTALADKITAYYTRGLK